MTIDSPEAREEIRQAITRHHDGIQALDLDDPDKHRLMKVIPEVLAGEGFDPDLVDRTLRDDLEEHLARLA
jgi:hypothetical protein